MTVGGAVSGGKAAFVAEELDDGAVVVYQGHTIGCAVLQSVGEIVDDNDSIATASVRNGATQGVGAGRICGWGGVSGSARAVVADDAPAGEVGSGGAGNFNGLASVSAGIIIMDFVDENGR